MIVERENGERHDRGILPVHVPSAPVPRNRQPRRQQRHHEHHAAHADPRRRLQHRQEIDLRISGAAPGAVRRLQREREIESDFKGREDQRRQHPGPSPRRLGRARNEGRKHDRARQVRREHRDQRHRETLATPRHQVAGEKGRKRQPAAVSIRISGAIARIGNGANSAHIQNRGSGPPACRVAR